jgi:hypothetical protein
MLEINETFAGESVGHAQAPPVNSLIVWSDSVGCDYIGLVIDVPGTCCGPYVLYYAGDYNVKGDTPTVGAFCHMGINWRPAMCGESLVFKETL